MGCEKDLRLLISKYLDGEVTPDERGQVDDHLCTCVPCRDFLSILRRNETLVAEALSQAPFGARS